jgi:hypothetical protein
MKYTVDDVQRFYFTLEKMADGDGRVSIDDALVVAFGDDPADFDAALKALGHIPDDRATDALAAAINAGGRAEAAMASAALRIEAGKNGEFAVYDDSSPETEEFNYGLIAYGFESRADAERYIAELGRQEALLH